MIRATKIRNFSAYLDQLDGKLDRSRVQQVSRKLQQEKNGPEGDPGRSSGSIT
jgi:hypothetical protein